jgi:hypothetical protein
MVKEELRAADGKSISKMRLKDSYFHTLHTHMNGPLRFLYEFQDFFI